MAALAAMAAAATMLGAMPGPGEAPAALAAEPVKERQVVYGITPWTGKEYGGTFAPGVVDTIYLATGSRHILDVLETDVYYWPITQEFMADWMEHRQEIAGKLEIRQGNRVVATLEKQPYTFVYPEGYFGGAVELAVGADASGAYERYQQAIDDYYEAATAYQEAEEAWRDQMSEILEEVQRTGNPADPQTLPKAPEAPEPPKLLVMQPSEGFIVELPEGKYTIRVLDAEGHEIAGTSKRLEVFGPRRSGVGYQIIPESKWTVPVESGDPSQVLYVSTEATFYLKAFDAREYNRHAYQRMIELAKPLAGSGQQSAWQWVMGAEREGLSLQVVQDGRVVQTVSPKPYYVQQAPGYALGYQIVDFDPSKPEFEGRQPSFEAYKVQLNPDPGARYSLRLVDEQGQVVAGSEREVLAVRPSPVWPLYAWPGVPLVVGLVVAGWRRRLRPKRLPEG